MKYCSKCGNECADEAIVCTKCGCSLASKNAQVTNDGNNVSRFLLTFFLGWIGSIIINHSSLKPAGWKSRSWAYFWLSMITFGIYGLVASICNFSFDTNKVSNIGYFKE